MPVLTKRVTEYPLPAAAQTHEIVAVRNSNMLVLTQQTDSTLVKVALDPSTGVPVRAVGHQLGKPTDGLHGLCASIIHPGMVWATLQFTSQLILVDPVSADVNAPPKILQTYDLPVAARGPHVVIEDGQTLWVSAKDGGQVVRIQCGESQPFTLYPSPRRPIFVAVQKSTGFVWATDDQSSVLLRIDPKTGNTCQVPIPPDKGNTPVGMIAGPDGNVWFVLLGGTGTFGRINDKENIDWYHLAANAWSNAAPIHLAWENDGRDGQPALLLLGSSMANSAAVNAVIRVTFSPQFGAIDTEAAAVMATANCMTHRVLSTPHGWYVTELGACQLAHVSRDWTGTDAEAIDEAGDYYSDFGMGAPCQAIDYQ